MISNTLLNGKVVVWYYVKDLPRAVEWYADVLGIKPQDQIDVANFFIINENTKLALSNRFKADEVNNLPVSAGLDLQSSDIQSTYLLLQQKGVKVDELKNPIFNYFEFYFSDLDNNQIRVHGFVSDDEKG